MRAHLFERLLPRVDRDAVDAAIKDGERERDPLVVKRAPLGVDDHLVESVLAVLLQLVRLVPHLGQLVDRLDVGAVGARAKDATAEAVAALVRGGHQGPAGVVDEGRAADVDVLPVEGVLQQLDDVLADRVLALEALRGLTSVTKPVRHLTPGSRRGGLPWSS